ncbi:MAG: DotU family type IV/VI secretion system protein [Spirochaetaceae bacterium]|jgi:type VI protein secretion system component VasF|nr:DotU family type IV/VI secretion system protein [Spirochaetaceae bacterium]
MYVSPDIEILCRPVFTCICNYWQLNGTGISPSMEKFRGDIKNALEDVKYRAKNNSELYREYEHIELPLVFFIDYMVKEGNFPFKNDWRELAKDYNELSGDEKFFNLLTNELYAPDAGDLIPIFYTMLGLGFDGIYVNDSKSVERIMKQCMEKLENEFDVSQEPIVAINTEKRLALSKKSYAALPFAKISKKILIAASIFTGLALIINFFVFLNISKPFRDSLYKATTSAQNFEIPSAGVSE